MSERPLPQLPGVEHRQIALRGFEMHVAQAGPADAEPVVLLHGWPQNWYAWRKLIGPLAERYRVICPDLRGFGWSEAPPGASYLKLDLADDVIALLDELGLDRVRLAGHDWGGFTGFLICIKAPERVSHYAAAGISHLWVRPQGGALERLKLLSRLWYMFLLASPLLGRQVVQRLPRFMETILVQGAGSKGAFSPEELEVFVSQWSEPERAKVTVAVYRSFLTREFTAIARGAYRDEVLEQPTVMLIGSEDPVIEAEGLAGAERNMPKAEIRELDGIGHWVPDEAPEAMLEAMLELYERPG